MRDLVGGIRRYFVYAALFSLAINSLLLVPAIYMLQVFDRVLSSRSEETLVMLSVAALLALAVMAALDVLRARLLAACGVVLDRRLGPQVLEGLLAQTARLSGAEHLNGLRDVATLRNFLVGAGVIALFDAPWLPLFLILIYLFHPVLGAVALAGAVLMLALAVLNERLTRAPLEQVLAAGRRAGRFVDAAAGNAETVSALGMQRAVTQRWQSLNEAALGEQAAASGLGATFAGLTKFTRQFIQMAMLGTGAYLVIVQHLSAGVMIAATIILGRALAPVEMLVAGWRNLVEVRGAWQRLHKLLAANPPAQSGTPLPAPQGRVTAERVVYGFPGAERPALRGVSFELQPGEALGVIGPTAAGKSTLARLVVGVWKPAAGAVRLDGADVASWARADLGPYVGYVPQSVGLFAGTVAGNIARLGEPDGEAVVRAAQRAHAHEMILRLPRGYDTEVGEAGAALSPGQRQRVALARALYGEPRLLVLDEPNANLDAEGDEALVRTLRDLKESRVTVVVVAHRPSLLSGVDKLLVLKDGVAEMFGPRAEIMARVTRVAPVRGAA
ncbi:MAG: type I secretion system permease/ATPase [Betaproteobacteria bacterium]|nr:type I secretion system permease/ATPase [Betaproteobacteria bacterium]